MPNHYGNYTVMEKPSAKEKNGLIRSEEHTSELQSQSNLVCRLLLEKKKKNITTDLSSHLSRCRLIMFLLAYISYISLLHCNALMLQIVLKCTLRLFHLVC